MYLYAKVKHTIATVREEPRYSHREFATHRSSERAVKPKLHTRELELRIVPSSEIEIYSKVASAARAMDVDPFAQVSD